MLKKTCYACNKERKKSKLVYDDDLKAYCKNSYECNSEHPNSPMNLVKNGKIIKLYEHDEALKIFAESNSTETIKHMSSPITIRLSDVRQAIHIEKVCTERNISTSDYIRSLIEQDINMVKVEVKQEEKQTDESELTF